MYRAYCTGAPDEDDRRTSCISGRMKAESFEKQREELESANQKV